ncbi:MAG: helix-turn-helix domain-containing protein [Candidatus Methylomirabilales bacterium]
MDHTSRGPVLIVEDDKKTASLVALYLTLMAAPGRVFTREELLNHLYPSGEAVIDRVIDVHIGKLRQKIEEDPSKPRYILTVRGVGYQFADPLPHPPP